MLAYFRIFAFLFGILIASEGLVAAENVVQSHIQILKQFFSKSLESEEKLEKALSKELLDLDTVDSSEQARLEKSLLEIKEQENPTLEQKANAELLSLKIQWIKTSLEQKKLLLADLRSKEISKNTEKKGELLQKEASQATLESQQTAQKIQKQVQRSKDQRESQLLDVRLQLENQNQDFLKAKKTLGKIQQRFSEQVDAWSQEETFIRKAIDLNESGIEVHLQTIEKRLSESNQRVLSFSSLHDSYFKVLNEELKSVQADTVSVNNDDTDSIKSLIQEIHRIRIDLKTSQDILLRQKDQLFLKLTSWEKDYRERLVSIRGDLIEKSALELNRIDSVFIEIRTIFSSASFWVWSFESIYINSAFSD